MGTNFVCQKYGELRGKQAGTSLPKTAFAVVYPDEMCFGLVRDFLAFSIGGNSLRYTGGYAQRLRGVLAL